MIAHSAYLMIEIKFLGFYFLSNAFVISFRCIVKKSIDEIQVIKMVFFLREAFWNMYDIVGGFTDAKSTALTLCDISNAFGCVDLEKGGSGL